MSNNFSNYKPKIPKKPVGEFAIPPQTYPEQMPSSFSKGQAKLHFEKDLAFQYKNYDGDTVFWVKRDEATRGGKKKFTPFSYIGKKNSDGEMIYTWHPKGWPKDRVLYGEELLKDNNKPVIIFEGEKATNAGRDLFKDHVCICWSSGSNSVFKSNFKRLAGRKVILWPDNDAEGLIAMHDVARTLILKEITEDIEIIELEQFVEQFDLKKGWDVADELENDFIDLHTILKTKREFSKDEKIWELLEKQEDKRSVEDAQGEIIDSYVYIRDRKDLFEYLSFKFVDRIQINDWFLHLTKKGPPMWTELLSNPELNKVHNYLTHAGLPPGIVEIKDNSLAYQLENI